MSKLQNAVDDYIANVNSENVSVFYDKSFVRVLDGSKVHSFIVKDGHPKYSYGDILVPVGTKVLSYYVQGNVFK